jgi:hypothetical protein
MEAIHSKSPFLSLPFLGNALLFYFDNRTAISERACRPKAQGKTNTENLKGITLR